MGELVHPGEQRIADQLFAPPDIVATRRPDGSELWESRTPLQPYPRCVGDWLCQRAVDAADRVFIAERPGGDPEQPWQTATYGEVHVTARRLGQALLDAGGSQQRPIAVLSGPSRQHAALLLAGQLVGVPVVSISVAYSLVAADTAKVRHIVEQTDPCLVFAEQTAPFSRSLGALGARRLVTGDGEAGTALTELAAAPTSDVDEAAAAVTPDHVAKVLYTSGSTGLPKGVITTHRMLCSNQQANTQIWPFVLDTPPVLCDWLPWSHTFAGSFDFNLVLSTGGTLYLDAGKPSSAELFATTVANLADVRPTILLNVPLGYARLVERLERDAAFAAAMLSRLQLIFYAAAALPQDVWGRLDAICAATIGRRVPMTSAWGLTETAPCVTAAHFPLERSGVIGVPIPGTTLKLAPSGSKLEVRVKGPQVTPGYLGDPERTAAAFDDEGFLRTGDAVLRADPEDANCGLLFDGRIAEDFKLSSGTWVSVGTLRPRLLAAVSPLLHDCVVTGHDRDWLGLLAWPAPGVVVDDALRSTLATRLAAHNAASGHTSSASIRRVLLLTDPPSIDRGETTDKGYTNQRAVLAARSHLVDVLHAPDPTDDVIVVDATRG